MVLYDGGKHAEEVSLQTNPLPHMNVLFQSSSPAMSFVSTNLQHLVQSLATNGPLRQNFTTPSPNAKKFAG